MNGLMGMMVVDRMLIDPVINEWGLAPKISYTACPSQPPSTQKIGGYIRIGL